MTDDTTVQEMCFFCNANPGGRYGICETCQKERFKIYEVTPNAADLSKVDFSLSHPHRELIRFMGERSGETVYDWKAITYTSDEDMKHDYRRYGEPFVDHMKRLVTMGFIREVPIVGQDKVLLRLTEWGFKIYKQIKNQINLVGINTLPPKA